MTQLHAECSSFVDGHPGPLPILGSTGPDAWASATAELLWLLQRARSVPEILSAALDAVPPTQHAAVSLGRAADPLHLAAATSSTARAAFSAQCDAGVGPWPDAHRVGVVQHLDPRNLALAWPELTTPLAAAGVTEVLCLPLRTPTGGVGVLGVIAEGVDLRSDDVHAATLLASALSFALASQERTVQFDQALAHRDLIGQAKGILMERHRLSDEEAFQLLVAVSQKRHVKLRKLAESVARTGQDPRDVDVTA